MTMQTTDETQPVYTILLVDDEPNILSALKRALYKRPYKVIVAHSGEEALHTLKHQAVQIIISDMKMPGMSGAQLLEKVAAQFPDTFRVILTGYADVDSTIQAVNQGKIHRFLQKPWQQDDLELTIEEGLERVRLKDENSRLQRLTQQQNIKLKEINASLEQTVTKRTRQIKAALHKIQKNNHALEQVLYNVISINPDIDGKFALEVSTLAEKLAKMHGLPSEQVNNIKYAGQLCEIGLLGLTPEDYRPAFNQLSYQQQLAYFSQTKQAALILAPAPHLQPVVDIIENQFEHFNGHGPNKRVGNAIPVGARIIAIARDYWRAVTGRHSGQNIAPDIVKAEMKKLRNIKYDGEILDLLLLAATVRGPKYVQPSFTAFELEPDMVLAENLYNHAHILILPEGHIFNDHSIRRLQQFERENGKQFAIHIKSDDDETAHDIGPDS